MSLIKLKSGYIIPLIPEFSQEYQIYKNQEVKLLENTYNSINSEIAVINTGGTISAFHTVLQGGVDVLNLDLTNKFSKLIPEPLFKLFKSLNKSLAYYNPFNILSQNITIQNLKILRELVQDLSKKFKSIIIMHGTDNLALSSSFLYYTLKVSIPVTFIGCQKSPDRPGSEIYQVLKDAITFNEKGYKGVYVLTYKNFQTSEIHYPFLLNKSDTYSRDTFISDYIFGEINSGKFSKLYTLNYQKKFIQDLKSDISDISKKIIFLELYPDSDFNIIKLLSKTHIPVLIGTGLGNLNYRLLKQISYLDSKIYLTTKCCKGFTSSEVYSNSRKFPKNLKLIGNNHESIYVKLLNSVI
jgi:L-asparaginase/Glu-tRNA(Gln) amidotransferase subunit D